MPVIHILLHGEKEALFETRRALQSSVADRTILFERMSLEVQDRVGVDIWECFLTKPRLAKQVWITLEQQAKKYPKMIYRVEDAHGNFLGIGNYKADDNDYPGPFGALCKAYGKVYRMRKEEGQ